LLSHAWLIYVLLTFKLYAQLYDKTFLLYLTLLVYVCLLVWFFLFAMITNPLVWANMGIPGDSSGDENAAA